MEHYSEYLIIGSGLAGTSAIEGIRAVDTKGSIGMVGAERDLPYDRPPLSKKLWFGKKKIEDIYLHEESFYRESGVDLFPGIHVAALNSAEKYVIDRAGRRYRFGKLLLATGGAPRILDIPGGNLEGIYYFRTLEDYRQLRQQAEEKRSAVVIGGGFIGSELAAALNVGKLEVTMIYPSGHMGDRVFPEDLGVSIEKTYENRNIRIMKKQRPVAIERNGPAFTVHTNTGRGVTSDLVLVGIGIRPAVGLAEQAGLSTGDGILVNEYLQTSNPDIYAAGDNARFPYRALNQQMRLEHWDNALNQGKQAGRNMAGAHEPFKYMPYFFSDLFEFGYEAVGEVNSQMEIVADWQKPYDTGVLYYTRAGVVRGMMMCNVWDKIEEARDRILRKARIGEERGPGARASRPPA